MPCCGISVHQCCKEEWEYISDNECPNCKSNNTDQTSSSSSSSSSSSKALESAQPMSCTICALDISCEATDGLEPIFCNYCNGVVIHSKCKTEWSLECPGADDKCPSCKRSNWMCQFV